MGEKKQRDGRTGDECALDSSRAWKGGYGGQLQIEAVKKGHLMTDAMVVSQRKQFQIRNSRELGRGLFEMIFHIPLTSVSV